MRNKIYYVINVIFFRNFIFHLSDFDVNSEGKKLLKHSDILYLKK
jgi:hypothetical protein